MATLLVSARVGLPPYRIGRDIIAIRASSHQRLDDVLLCGRICRLVRLSAVQALRMLDADCAEFAEWLRGHQPRVAQRAELLGKVREACTAVVLQFPRFSNVLWCDA